MKFTRQIKMAALPLTLIAGSAGLSGCATPNIATGFANTPQSCMVPTNGGRDRAYDDICAQGRQMVAVLNATAQRPNERYMVEMIVAASIDEISKTNPAAGARLLADVTRQVPSFDYNLARQNLAANAGRTPCIVASNGNQLNAVCDLDGAYDALITRSSVMPAPQLKTTPTP